MENMKLSVCLSVLNEQRSIGRVLDCLSLQTLRPDQIIIVDAGSFDKTVDIVKKYKNVKLIIKNKCSRSKARNIAVKSSRNKYIAITDAGCIPDKDWLLEISKPFKNKSVDVVAGVYNMTFDNQFQKAMSVYLGVNPNKVGENFIPSARSMAFTKEVWKKAGDFPESINGAGEDTLFNHNLKLINAKFVVAKKAIVDWKMPGSIFEFALKIYGYAKGDAQSAIWWDRDKKLKTHNLKVVSIFLRYLLAFVLYKFGIYPLLIYVFVYFAWAIKKAGWWGMILQVVSDLSAMLGFIDGQLNLLETD